MDKSMRTVQDLHGTSINPLADIGLASVDLEGLVGRKILIAVSGGVDSTTTAVLLRRAGADGTQLMINTGFLRQDEPAAPVLDLEAAGLRVEVVDERQRFHEAMQGKKTGGERRDAFRDLYFDVLADFMRVRDIDVIAQGTQFHQIVAKQAHNEPTRRFLDNKFEVVEPVAGLTKSQIRVLARALGVPDNCVTRRPFPGPGLILRFGGEYTREKLELIRAATHVVDTFVHQHAEDFTECYQIFPYLTDQEPVTYVDHSGAGSYGAVLLLRAVREEFHGRTIVYRPFTVPDRLSGGLVERLMAIPGIARVCWDLTPKFGSGVDVAPGATIEYA
jgi:GMP synthase (glutamine-hydrolysing) B subunit